MTVQRRQLIATLLILAAWVECPSALLGQVTFRLTIEDRAKELTEGKTVVEGNLRAAAELWADKLEGKASIEILLRVDRNANAGRGSGASATTSKVQPYGKNIIYEQAVAAKIRTGKGPNRDGPDVVIVLHPDYLKTMWFDPDPKYRTAHVPTDRLDAVSVFLHEIGHALAFNGWLDQRTGELKGEAMSTYDRYVVHDGQNFYFVGLEALKVYGRPIPLGREHNNYHHVGNTRGGPDAALADDLMNGIVFEYGKRYSISRLDLAIVADTGVPVKKASLHGEAKPK
jgi:hypothetical protein